MTTFQKLVAIIEAQKAGGCPKYAHFTYEDLSRVVSSPKEFLAFIFDAEAMVAAYKTRKEYCFKYYNRKGMQERKATSVYSRARSAGRRIVVMWVASNGDIARTVDEAHHCLTARDLR